MPNHCHNDVYIYGPDAEVKRLLELVGASKGEPEFNFDAIIPYPKRFKDADEAANKLKLLDRLKAGIKDGFNSGGYEWCCENWGTKWNAYQVKRRDYCGACVTFQTAWNTPMPVFQALHVLFPLTTIRVEWFERGQAVAGGYSFFAKEDWYEDGEWKPGLLANEWQCENYLGHRGG